MKALDDDGTAWQHHHKEHYKKVFFKSDVDVANLWVEQRNTALLSCTRICVERAPCGEKMFRSHCMTEPEAPMMSELRRSHTCSSKRSCEDLFSERTASSTGAQRRRKTTDK